MEHLLSRVAAVEQDARVQLRCHHTFKCQLWLLKNKRKCETHHQQKPKKERKQNSWNVARQPDLVVLGKRHGVSLHVQDAGDGVALSEGGQRAHQLASVVQVAAVRTVQPHVGGGVVVVISHRPARHANARALVAPVLLGDVELQRRRPDVRQEGKAGRLPRRPEAGPHLPNEAAGRDGGGCEAVAFAS